MNLLCDVHNMLVIRNTFIFISYTWEYVRRQPYGPQMCEVVPEHSQINRYYVIIKMYLHNMRSWYKL